MAQEKYIVKAPFHGFKQIVLKLGQEVTEKELVKGDLESKLASKHLVKKETSFKSSHSK